MFSLTVRSSYRENRCDMYPIRFLISSGRCGIDAGDGHLAGGGAREAAENPDCSGFACAVGTEEAEYLTFIYIKCQVVIGDERPEPLHQIFNLYDFLVLSSPFSFHQFKEDIFDAGNDLRD